jgi:hypothetical protein
MSLLHTPVHCFYYYTHYYYVTMCLVQLTTTMGRQVLLPHDLRYDTKVSMCLVQLTTTM